jgi:hypothetical protein
VCDVIIYLEFLIRDIVVQEQLEKMAGKKQKKTEDEIQREMDNTAAGVVSLSSKKNLAAHRNLVVVLWCCKKYNFYLHKVIINLLQYRSVTCGFQIGNDSEKGDFQGRDSVESTQGNAIIASYD